LRARLAALPPNIAGGWLLDRLGASDWDVEMICVIEAAMAEVRGDVS
jgi:hypothetical protein